MCTVGNYLGIIFTLVPEKPNHNTPTRGPRDWGVLWRSSVNTIHNTIRLVPSTWSFTRRYFVPSQTAVEKDYCRYVFWNLTALDTKTIIKLECTLTVTLTGTLKGTLQPIVHRQGDDLCYECDRYVRKISWRMTSCYYPCWNHSHSTRAHYTLRDMLDVFSLCVAVAHCSSCQ